MLSRNGIISRRRVLAAVLISCLSLVPPVFAADPQQVYQEATEALYSLDFSKAESGFVELSGQYPDNPDYWNARASVVWLKILYDQQKLNMESFSGRDSFGTGDSKDAVAPEDEAKLRAMVDQAMTRANAALKKNPKDVQALYALGVSNATLASFEGTVQRSYRSAHSKARTARDLHEQVLKLDPGFHDAELTIGIYNYVVGVIPFPVRMLLSVFGVRGDGKDVGIRQLETAAAKGKRAAIDAKMLLIVVYNREQQFDRSLKLLDELHGRYPRNFMFEMSKGIVLGKMNRWDQAVDAYARIADKATRRVDGYERLRVEKVFYELGNAQIQAHRFDDAAASFGRVAASAASTPNEKGSSHLWIGKVLDGKKERAKAVEHYKAVEALDCDPALKKEARDLVRKPFGSR